MVESILEPAKVILTGYEVERIETDVGQVITGVVRDSGKEWKIITPQKVIMLPKYTVADRKIQKSSIVSGRIE